MDDVSILRSELETARSFLALLKEEESALVSGDTERLLDIVQHKSAHLQKMAALSQERNQQLPPSDMTTWLEGHPEASETWQNLVAVAGEIRLINEINGNMIDVRLRSTQQALNMLQSLAHTTTSLYGPDGQSSISTSSQSRESA